jgi:hypothetical protein
MTGIEMVLGIVIGIVILMLIVSALTFIITQISTKEVSSMRNVYLGRLANSDSSIQNAMKYIKLTNGIKQYNNGEKSK